MYTIDEVCISYFESQVLIPWQQIVSIAIYSPEQTNDKTWKVFIKMGEGYQYPSNWWMRINVKNNRRISHGNADFIIIASYLSSPPQQTIEAILNTYRQYKK
jgi:nucleoside-specific outer membrane channel protein Tsx